tara:strand:- start:325 stop:654 length:330 start_codon:yes stop_codon:yes gene_type:complete
VGKFYAPKGNPNISYPPSNTIRSKNKNMTKSIKFGVREKLIPRKEVKKTKPISDDVINQDEVSWNQHLNKLAQDKIDNTYFEAIERLNKVQGFIIEGAMRKHKKDEEDY